MIIWRWVLPLAVALLGHCTEWLSFVELDRRVLYACLSAKRQHQSCRIHISIVQTSSSRKLPRFPSVPHVSLKGVCCASTSLRLRVHSMTWSVSLGIPPSIRSAIHDRSRSYFARIRSSSFSCFVNSSLICCSSLW